jgi:hypothetical protein
LDDRLEQLRTRVDRIIAEKGQLRMRFDHTAYLHQKLDDIEKNYRTQLRALCGESGEEKHKRREVLKHLILLANLASGQTSKSIIDLWVIGADDSEVAGDDFFAFAGFFEKGWREHDFRAGRKATYNQLGRILGASYPMEPDPRGAGHLNRHYDINPGWLHFKRAKLGDASGRKRKRLCSLLVDKLDSILKDELNLGWFSRWAIRCFFLGPALKKQLQL